MDLKQLAQDGVDMFNDRSFRTKSKDLMDPNVIVTDGPTGQEFRGPDGYIQFAEGFVSAMPDIKGTALGHNVDGNTVNTRVHAEGTFTGTMHTPQGDVPGNGKALDIEYDLTQEFNNDGKVTRFTVNYDMQKFMSQLGLA